MAQQFVGEADDSLQVSMQVLSTDDAHHYMLCITSIDGPETDNALQTASTRPLACYLCAGKMLFCGTLPTSGDRSCFICPTHSVVYFSIWPSESIACPNLCLPLSAVLPPDTIPDHISVSGSEYIQPQQSEVMAPQQFTSYIQSLADSIRHSTMPVIKLS